MGALLRVNMQRKGFGPLLATLDETDIIFRRPLAGARGVAVERGLRLGVRKQFDMGGDPAWPDTHPFGDFQPAAIVLGGSSGRVAQAWEKAPAEKGPREVRLRVTDKIALAHHRGTTIRPRQAPSKMRFALGVGLGVWMSEERLQTGLVLPQRPVRFTPEMALAAKLSIFAGFAGGNR